jgi:hypothetical protein
MMTYQKIAGQVRALVVMILAVTLVGACASIARDDSAANLIPNLGGYTVTNTLDIQDSIAKVAGGAALLAAQPQITAMIGAASSFLSCLQQVGAVEGRVFIRNSNPLHAGALVVVNKTKLANFETLVGCALPGSGARFAAQMQPCSKTYTLKKGETEYFIAYVATDESVCTELCNGLEGCLAAP